MKNAWTNVETIVIIKGDNSSLENKILDDAVIAEFRRIFSCKNHIYFIKNGISSRESE